MLVAKLCSKMLELEMMVTPEEHTETVYCKGTRIKVKKRRETK